MIISFSPTQTKDEGPEGFNLETGLIDVNSPCCAVSIKTVSDSWKSSSLIRLFFLSTLC